MDICNDRLMAICLCLYYTKNAEIIESSDGEYYSNDLKFLYEGIYNDFTLRYFELQVLVDSGIIELDSGHGDEVFDDSWVKVYILTDDARQKINEIITDKKPSLLKELSHK